jgi:phosphatidylserine/phosphatidylglycerophosphate/cardiolipin synthase-like enzyme
VLKFVLPLKYRRPDGTSHLSLRSSLALGSITVAIFLGYWWWNRLQPGAEANIAPLPQDESIQVYFNHNQATQFTEPYRSKTRRGDDLAAILIAAIADSRSQIDVAVQELQLPNIAEALVAKSQAGIKVRVILENNYSRPSSELTTTEVENLPARAKERYQEFQKLVDLDRDGSLSQAEIDRRDALVILRNGGVTVIDDTADSSKGSGLMHHKFMVVDGMQTIVTSANWTMSDIYGDISRPESEGNQNNLVRIHSAEVAQAFATEFNLMWGNGTANNPSSQFKARKPVRLPVTVFVGKTRVSVQFSPTSKQQAWEDSSNGSIGKLLASSHDRVDLALFVFSEPSLANILQTQSQQGVKVRGLIDRQFAYRTYSSALTLLGVDGSNLCQVALVKTPALSTLGVPTLPTGDLLHHKFAVIDGSTVITGSHNWSNAANYHNDETLLAIQDNPVVAAHFDREFERLYQHAAIGIPSKLQRQGCE